MTLPDKTDLHELQILHDNCCETLATQAAQIKALRKDAERWDYCLKHASWYRAEDRTYFAVPVAADADLSCIAMRTAAIDAAMGPGL